ncbi:MAG: hypothetical protein J5486_04645 [Bacteroidaceae bacterium]|nr:hypothetical protein [Bacteroidaceae bacterium]
MAKSLIEELPRIVSEGRREAQQIQYCCDITEGVGLNYAIVYMKLTIFLITIKTT